MYSDSIAPVPRTPKPQNPVLMVCSKPAMVDFESTQAGMPASRRVPDVLHKPENFCGVGSGFLVQDSGTGLRCDLKSVPQPQPNLPQPEFLKPQTLIPPKPHKP